MKQPARADAALDALADALVPRLVPRILEAVREQSDAPAHYTQRDAPMGRRRFLELARAGTFATTKRGRLVFARRDDVDRWIAHGARPTVVESIEALVRRRVGGEE